MKHSVFTLGAAALLVCMALATFLLSPNAEATVAVTTGTVSGRLYDWPTPHMPLAGRRVELRSGIGNQLIAWQNSNASGYFTFWNVQTSPGRSFHVVASPSSHAANWYFVLNSGQAQNQNPLILSFWP